ncbi:MAG: DNA mismatch repair protein MutS [Candidatus Dojkabacteria bacterium]
MSTPMEEQFNRLKQQHPDTILLFRLGDFYEGFDEDARRLSRVLGITLTGRGKDENRRPMAGIPYHALNQYLPKLVKAGLKVAIAEQMEDAKPGKLVEREIVKIITAGTVMDEESLTSSENNYVAALELSSIKSHFIWGLSYADLSTGEFHTGEYISNSSEVSTDLLTELFRMKPAEILLLKKNISDNQLPLSDFNITYLEPEQKVGVNEARRVLTALMGVSNLKGYGLEELTTGLSAAAMLVNYLKETQKTTLEHVRSLGIINKKDFMLLDQTTIRALELLFPIQPDAGLKQTLYGTLNNCKTPMGQRMLRNWILHPLINAELIIERLDNVEAFVSNRELAHKVATKLDGIMDLERIIARLGTKNVNARDLLFIKEGITNALKALDAIYGSRLRSLQKFKIAETITEVLKQKVAGSIVDAIKPDPGITITEGNIIRREHDKQLDKIKSEEEEGKQYIKDLQKQEIRRTGISSLKVKFNKVFGYYIEVSKSNIDKVPENYIRKQTLVNAERYITDKLKHWEGIVLGAEEKAAALEFEIFTKLRDDLIGYIPQMQKLSRVIAEVDVINNFARLADEYSYVKPGILSDPKQQTTIKNSRHPVVERTMPERFIANDLAFDFNTQQLIILTGPNMSGKSTYIRQAALLFIMAQIGCFVPADEAKIVIADRIFTRVGAADNLAGGESTFMVEMNETANILNNATERSLLILDEVGRGTSTFDGVAIAWAIVEHIGSRVHARTLFATHYHELISLEEQYNSIRNYNVAVKEDGEQIIFLHKIIEGATDQSYGIHVAQIAGIPESVISRSRKLLRLLEEDQLSEILGEKSKFINVDQLSFGEIRYDDKLRSQIKELDLNSLTPIEALNKLQQLQAQLKDEEQTAD